MPGLQVIGCGPASRPALRTPAAPRDSLEGGDRPVRWPGRGGDGVFLPSSGPSKPERVQRVLFGWGKKENLRGSSSPGGGRGTTGRFPVSVRAERPRPPSWSSFFPVVTNITPLTPCSTFRKRFGARHVGAPWCPGPCCAHTVRVCFLFAHRGPGSCGCPGDVTTNQAPETAEMDCVAVLGAGGLRSRGGQGCSPLPVPDFRSPTSERVAEPQGLASHSLGDWWDRHASHPRQAAGHAPSARGPWPLACCRHRPHSCREWPPEAGFVGQLPRSQPFISPQAPAGVLRGALPWHGD